MKRLYSIFVIVPSGNATALSGNHIWGHNNSPYDALYGWPENQRKSQQDLVRRDVDIPKLHSYSSKLHQKVSITVITYCIATHSVYYMKLVFW